LLDDQAKPAERRAGRVHGKDLFVAQKASGMVTRTGTGSVSREELVLPALAGR